MANMYEDAELPDGVELFDFEDYNKHRQMIFDDAKNTLIKQFPMERNGVRMEVKDVDYTDPDSFTLREQKMALHNDDFLRRRLRGTVVLKDANTGDILDEKKMTLMDVPWLSNRGTFIRGGNEWGSISQKRLLPGAYSRYQNNGDLETQFNVRPGTGGAFRVQFNPETTQYKMAIKGGEVHLYSLLHDMGVSDEDLEQRWGKEILEQNKAKYDSRTLDKAYSKIVPEWDRNKNSGRTAEEKAKLIKESLERSQMATAVARRTLPNLFSREKAAAWREGGELMSKCASMSRTDLEDIATYINAAGEHNIDLDAPKSDLKKQIVAAITEQPEPMAKDSDAVNLVRRLHMKRVAEIINKKLKTKNFSL